MRNKKIATDGQSVANGRESSGGDLSSNIVHFPPSSPQSSLDQIEILDAQHITGRGAVKMICRVRYGLVIFAGVRVVLPALASRPFVSMPSRKIGDDWEPLVSILNPILNDVISNAVLAEYHRGSR